MAQKQGKVLLVVLLCLSNFSYGQSERQVENISTFNRLYGYIKYFYPGDEAAAVDWDAIASYGSRRVENCADDSQLQKTLLEIFKPIAPAIKIFKTGEVVTFSKAEITPPKIANYKTVTWQHFGVGLGNFNNTYYSARLNRKRDPRDQVPDVAFSRLCKPGEFSTKKIGSGLSVIFPLALYGNEDSTFPQANPEKLAALNEQMKGVVASSPTDLYVRLGDLTITWNVFQHFYPYFDVAKTNWLEDFKVAVRDAYSDTTAYDFVVTLRKMTAHLKDGHINVYSSSGFGRESFYPPFTWEWVENQLVITHVFTDNMQVKAGDIVTAVNHRPAREYYEQSYTYISAATKGWRERRAQMTTLAGAQNSEMTLSISNETGKSVDVAMKRHMNGMQYYSAINDMSEIKSPILKISDGVYYVNISAASMTEIDERMPELKNAKSLICDLRGYPKGNHGLINYLLKRNDADEWMFIPKIIYPDQENIVGYKGYGWSMQAAQPHLEAKVFFLVDGSAISYAESYMGFIEHYKLATIVGQPTAGTNGNVNPFKLPGEINISWTGMKVLKHDGSPLHGVGILPNVYVEKTIKGVRNKQDEFLDKAIELAEKEVISGTEIRIKKY